MYSGRADILKDKSESLNSASLQYKHDILNERRARERQKHKERERERESMRDRQTNRQTDRMLHKTNNVTYCYLEVSKHKHPKMHAHLQ